MQTIKEEHQEMRKCMEPSNIGQIKGLDKVGETLIMDGMEEMQRCPAREVKVVDKEKPTLEQILSSQPLNPLRLLEFRPLPLNENQPAE